MSELPDWVNAQVDRWAERLGLDGYRVQVSIRPLRDDPDGRVNGECTSDARYLTASITLAPHLVDDALGRHTVAHELAHVLLAELAAVAEHLINQLAPAAGPLAQEMWHDAQERTIERLVRALEREDRDRAAPPAA